MGSPWWRSRRTASPRSQSRAVEGTRRSVATAGRSAASRLTAGVSTAAVSHLRRRGVPVRRMVREAPRQRRSRRAVRTQRNRRPRAATVAARRERSLEESPGDPKSATCPRVCENRLRRKRSSPRPCPVLRRRNGRRESPDRGTGARGSGGSVASSAVLRERASMRREDSSQPPDREPTSPPGDASEASPAAAEGRSKHSRRRASCTLAGAAREGSGSLRYTGGRVSVALLASPQDVTND